MSVAIDGYLKKRTKNTSVLKKQWNKRWFTLAGNLLSYAASSKHKAPNGVFQMSDLKRVRQLEGLEFELVFPLRSLRLKASDTVELRRWTEALQAGLRIVRGGSHAAANATEGEQGDDAPLGVFTTSAPGRPNRRPPLPHEELDDEPEVARSNRSHGGTPGCGREMKVVADTYMDDDGSPLGPTAAPQRDKRYTPLPVASMMLREEAVAHRTPKDIQAQLSALALRRAEEVRARERAVAEDSSADDDTSDDDNVPPVAAVRTGRADARARLKVPLPRQEEEEEEEERLDMGESSPTTLQRRLGVPPIPAVVDRRASIDSAASYGAPPKHEAGVDTDCNWLDELWDEDSPGAPRKAAASGAKSPPTSPQEQNAEDTVQAFLDENWDSDPE